MRPDVVLEAALADDLSVVNAARVSLNARSDAVGEREAGLIRFLIRERHGSPFEHGYLRFRVHCPIFVAREWFRHRIGSFNEWSGRYSEIATDFFVPGGFRRQTGKAGAYRYEEWPEVYGAARNILEEAYTAAEEAYRELLALGVAREQARVVLPVSTYTTFIWSVNPRSLMNFLSLRTAETAMKEIRDLAVEVEAYFAELMPITHAAWIEHGRRAP